MLLDYPTALQAEHIAARLIRCTPSTMEGVETLKSIVCERVRKYHGTDLDSIRRNMLWAAVRDRVVWYYTGFYVRHGSARDESVAQYERGLDDGMRICGHAPDGGDIAEEVTA